MSLLMAAIVALLGVFAGVAHSTLGERYYFRKLALEDQHGVLKPRYARPVIRAVFHLPSVTWAVLGVAVLIARLDGGDVLISAVAAIIFAVSGAANIWALRAPHFGGLILLTMAGLTVADALLV
jgi:hypothetical protein